VLRGGHSFVTFFPRTHDALAAVSLEKGRSVRPSSMGYSSRSLLVSVVGKSHFPDFRAGKLPQAAIATLVAPVDRVAKCRKTMWKCWMNFISWFALSHIGIIQVKVELKV
jgi:hypothetical protein